MRAFLLALSAGACLLMTGCPIPLSTHPLSDETSSEIDQRLIGTWEIDVRHVHEKLGNKEGDPTATYHLERTDASKTTLQCAYQRGEGQADASLPFYTTHLGMHDYFSLASRVGDNGKFYVICRYELDDDNNGRFYLMDEHFIIEQIESGKIAGQVDRNDGGVQGVRLDADSEKLRELVRRHGDKVFDMKHPLACKRVKPSVAQE